MAYTYQATGSETEIYEQYDDEAVPVILVPFLDSETPEEHQARVRIVVDAMNAAQTTETVAPDPVARLRTAAIRAISANAIVAATNTADLADPEKTFDAIHDVANDLTISTQTAFAQELGWLDEDAVLAKDVPPTGLLYLDKMTHGGASDQEIEHAFENATGQSVGVAKNV